MIMFIWLKKKIRCPITTEAQSKVMTIFFTCRPDAHIQESASDTSEYPQSTLRNPNPSAHLPPYAYPTYGCIPLDLHLQSASSQFRNPKLEQSCRHQQENERLGRWVLRR